MLDLKALLAKILNHINQPPIIAIAFTSAITSKTTGSKTASIPISIPSGYALVPDCRPVGCYVSGSPVVTITDRGNVQLSNSNIVFSYYLYNPQNFTGNLRIAGSVLCYKQGGGNKLLNFITKFFKKEVVKC